MGLLHLVFLVFSSPSLQSHQSPIVRVWSPETGVESRLWTPESRPFRFRLGPVDGQRDQDGREHSITLDTAVIYHCVHSCVTALAPGSVYRERTLFAFSSFTRQPIPSIQTFSDSFSKGISGHQTNREESSADLFKGSLYCTLRGSKPY